MPLDPASGTDFNSLLLIPLSQSSLSIQIRLSLSLW
jgi:hypothetical protein